MHRESYGGPQRHRTHSHAQTNMQTHTMKTQFLFKLRQPRCQTFDSGWGVPSPEIKTTRKKEKKKNDEARKKNAAKEKKDRRRGKKSSVVLPDGNAMLTFPFVVSPSRVESQNSRTTAMRKKKKKADKTAGGEWLWKLKRKGRAKKKLTLGRPLQRGRVQHTEHSDHQIYAGSRREKCLLCGRTQCAGQRNLDMTLKCPSEGTELWLFGFMHAEFSLRSNFLSEDRNI